MKLSEFDENKRPNCQWKDCKKRAAALLPWGREEYLPLCFEHYNIARRTGKVDLK